MNDPKKTESPADLSGVNKKLDDLSAAMEELQTEIDNDDVQGLVWAMVDEYITDPDKDILDCHTEHVSES